MKIQKVNVADEEITCSGRVSGSSQDVIVPLSLIQFLYVRSAFERTGLMIVCFLTHSINEELEEAKESFALTVRQKQSIMRNDSRDIYTVGL